ncbi:MAG: hypothetical protein SPK03_03225 [Alloprevotella sp.]|nr:hypothetical protein [Alloprevotella sp.]
MIASGLIAQAEGLKGFCWGKKAYRKGGFGASGEGFGNLSTARGCAGRKSAGTSSPEEVPDPTTNVLLPKTLYCSESTKQNSLSNLFEPVA